MATDFGVPYPAVFHPSINASTAFCNSTWSIDFPLFFRFLTCFDGGLRNQLKTLADGILH